MRFLMLFGILILSTLSCSKKTAPAAPEQQEKFQEGVHYTIVEGREKPKPGEPIEVMEVFWYGCEHCYVFEVLLNSWKKTLADDVSFVRSPAMWEFAKGTKNAMWTHGQVYYAAESMGILDKLHPMFFQTIHKYKIRMVDHADIKKLLDKMSLDSDAFLKVLDSPEINEKVKEAEARLKTYKVTGTPEIIVGQYYHVTSRQAGSQKDMLEVVDFLLDKIRADR